MGVCAYAPVNEDRNDETRKSRLKGSAIVWVMGKTGLIKYIWVCAGAPVYEEKKGRRYERVKVERLLVQCG